MTSGTVTSSRRPGGIDLVATQPPAGGAPQPPPFVPSFAAAPATVPLLHSRAAAVIDGDTLQVIGQQAGHEQLPMASLTKVMTAMVALQTVGDDLNAPMSVPPAAARVIGERVYLQAGQTYTFGQMLDAMLVQSANDAAITIAVNALGTQAAFVRRMNAEAAALGLHDTHFANVHGLDAPGHYSSALDLARLGAIAMRNPVIARIVAMRTATIPWPGRGKRVLYNHNYLLGTYPGATGVKIGYTSDALNCVIGTAVRGGHEVVAVVMGELPRYEWRDESALLDYGFEALPALPAPSPPPAVVRAHPPARPMRAPSRPRGAGRPWPSFLGLAALAVVTALVTVRGLR